MKQRITEERILSLVKINPSSGCWEWQGRKHISGYGYSSHKSGERRVHRIFWTLFNGNFDRSLFVLHKCDNKVCVNPKHLFLGTHQDNMDDRSRKGRCVNPKGSHHGQAKLTEEIVIKIRNSSEKGAMLSKKLGISNGTVSLIRNNRIWTHI